MTERYDHIHGLVESVGGGLATATGLAKRWGVTPQRAAQITRHRTFPRPIEVDGGSKVWLVHQADEAREAIRSRSGGSG